MMVIYTRVSNTKSHFYVMMYWTGDVIFHGLIFLLVLFLIREALVGIGALISAPRMILAPVLIFVGVTLYLLYQPVR